ncbi:MAG: glycosyltransferase family 39 protein [Anaerolineae bacterium]|nr:glycosyltransferase family 39 protein [Anaerolineae bacterium]
MAAQFSSRPSLLSRNWLPGVTVAWTLVAALMALSLGLHLFNIGSIGDANAYYTATVKSMLQSWRNFFFAAAEPGGSVTVDKPPLGFWMEAAFAAVLGVSGFSTALPNILVGVCAVPVLYAIVRRHAGEGAGLVAALAMTLTPVFVATNRNNTIDGMLVFVLLLAAWAFVQATESGRLRWLLLGAFLVGLGFNIKMLQAFLPLPAFYALYFLGSREGWGRKLVHLALATVLLLAVSFSWAIAVDLTPPDQRPYIGSSGDNSVMSLIFGYNGLSRVLNRGMGGSARAVQAPQGMPFSQAPVAPGALPAPQAGPQPGAPGLSQQAIDACTGLAEGATCSFSMASRTVTGTCSRSPSTDQLVCMPQGGPGTPPFPQGTPPPGALPQVGRGTTPFSNETGNPGVLRFFTAPLSKQMSWLLPFALVSLVLPLFGRRVRLPLGWGTHRALVLWGGWLVTGLMFFSIVSGIFHAYYTIMLAPALGAVVGMGAAWFWDRTRERPRVGVLLVAAAAGTLAYQAFAFQQYNEPLGVLAIAALLLLAGGLLLASAEARRVAVVLILAAMLFAPAYWTGMTVAAGADQNLPSAYPGARPFRPGPGLRAGVAAQPGVGMTDADLVAYLQANTQDVEYLVAVPSSQTGAPLVLATGRPVLYMGGFSGQDRVVTAEDLQEMVASGRLRYILYGGMGGRQDIAAWLQASCTVVPEFSPAGGEGQGGPVDRGTVLYRCGESTSQVLWKSPW